MFGRKKNAFATYSKSKPVQVATKDHFPTPETPDDLWIPSSKDKSNSRQAAFPPVKAKGKWIYFEFKEGIFLWALNVRENVWLFLFYVF